MSGYGIAGDFYEVYKKKMDTNQGVPRNPAKHSWLKAVYCCKSFHFTCLRAGPGYAPDKYI